MDLRAEYVFFEEGFDFVIEDNTENLQDGHALVSDLEIPAGTIAYKDTVALLVQGLEALQFCSTLS